MFDPTLLGLFLLAVLLLNLTPGPDMLFCFASGLSQGREAGLAAAAGVSLGVLGHAVAAGLGVAALLRASPYAFDLLRYLGAGYLLWLAWQSWLAGGERGIEGLAGREAVEPASSRASRLRYLKRGAITNLLNPKVALFFLAFLPQFATPQAALPIGMQLTLLGALIALTSMIINGVVGLSAGALAQGLLRRPGLLALQRRAAAIIFAALALRLLLDEAF